MKKMIKRCIPILFLSILLISASAANIAASASGNSSVDATVIGLDKIEFSNPDLAWYCARCNVENHSDQDGTVIVKLQTVNKWGFKQKEIRLSGHVKAGESAILTLTNFMERDTFENIGEVYVKSVEMH